MLHTLVIFALQKANTLQHVIKLCIPCSWCLLEVVECFFKLEDPLLLSFFHVALQLIGIDLLLDFTIQEGRFHIQMMQTLKLWRKQYNQVTN